MLSHLGGEALTRKWQRLATGQKTAKVLPRTTLTVAVASLGMLFLGVAVLALQYSRRSRP